MDEATLARLSELVKGMHEQGMSVKQISDNLSQMGISNEDIDVIVSRAGLAPNTADIHDAVNTVNQQISTGEAVKPVMDKLNEADEHFERLHQGINSLHEKHNELSKDIQGLSASSQELSEIKSMLIEVRELLNAVKDLQMQLLDVNKKILMKETLK